MMKKFVWLLFFSLFVFGNSYSQDVFSRVQTNIANQLLAGTGDLTLAKNVISYLPQLQSDGSWPDIEYNSNAVTKWKPGLHLERVKDFALSYIKPGNIYFQHSDLYNVIVKALRYWYSQDPKSSNWWHNEIATPQTLGEIMILMHRAKNKLPQSLQDSLVSRMKRGNIFKQTGANKLDVAIHYLYRACITRDERLMDTAVSQAFQPIEFTTAEGLQYDYSYLQHGPQLQISSYGLVFLSGEYKVASWVSGTRYALSGEKLKMLDHYLTKTFLSSIRGRYSDFNIEGRGISRPNILDKKSIAGNKGKNSLLELAKLIGGENTKIIDAAIERINDVKPASYGISPLHNHYWIGDYTQHLRPSYSFNVRMVSDRTKRTEAGNKENLLGKLLPDGSTNIQRSGKEYYNIMPVWEWDKIPGITSRDFVTDQPTTVQWGEAGSTSFVGGVSDGTHGASAYDMDYNDAKAKKAWFFFDNEVVSLGAGINSNSPESIVTTINQCWLNGKVLAREDERTSTLKKDKTSQGFNWVWHDSIGYFFPEKENVSISSKSQSGNWNKINKSYSKDELSGKVFKMWVNQGVTPRNGHYSYITVPGISSEDMKNYDKNEIVILSNTPSIQAVAHTGLDIMVIQGVFYQAGTVDVMDIDVSVDKPCIVLLKRQADSISISVADPTHKIKEVVMLIKSTVTNSEKKLVFKLPEGPMAGSSAHFRTKL
jgi:chondroitin AC lyase